MVRTPTLLAVLGLLTVGCNEYEIIEDPDARRTQGPLLPDVPIAEDLHWGRRHRVGYVPGAPVVHSHARRPGPLYRRTRDIHRQHTALGEPARVPSLTALLRALPGVVPPVLQAGLPELPNQLAELFGQWRGGR